MTSPNLREFEENIQYARALIAGGIALQGQGLRDFPAHPEDLYRAAWSQAVSAMDHWLHDELIERAVVLANDLGKVRTSRMNDLKVPFADVERMRGVSFPVVFREFLAKEFERRSFHGTTDVSDGMKLVCDLTPDRLWIAVGRASSLTKDQAKQRHNDVIRRRNDISHRADRDGSGRRQPMTDGEVTAAVDWVDTLVHELHRLLG
jgi:restriction system protein